MGKALSVGCGMKGSKLEGVRECKCRWEKYSSRIGGRVRGKGAWWEQPKVRGYTCGRRLGCKLKRKWVEENSWLARQKREEKQAGVTKKQNGKVPNPEDGITGRFLPRAAMQKPVFLCVNGLMWGWVPSLKLKNEKLYWKGWEFANIL